MDNELMTGSAIVTIMKP